MGGHVVTAGCVVARTLDGGEQYFYAGAVLPATVSAEEKDRLVEAGLVDDIDDGAVGDAVSVDPSPDDSAVLDAIVGEQEVEDGDLVDVVEAVPGSVVEDAPVRGRRGRRA